MKNIAKCMIGLMGVCLPLAAQNDFRALGWSQSTAYHADEYLQYFGREQSQYRGPTHPAEYAEASI